MMDTEYRGFVRFKDFHKFVKKHKARTLDIIDSDSCSGDSDIVDEVIKDYWRKLDPYH